MNGTLREATQPAWVRAFLLALLVAIAGTIWLNRPYGAVDDNLYLYQADALLDGRLDIPTYSSDVATYAGRYYVPFPPLPTFVLLPLVSLLGTSLVKLDGVGWLITGANALVLTRLFRRLGVEPTTRPWLVIAFLLGTAYWQVILKSEGVWFFALTMGVTCTLLALHEALGAGRGFAVGLLLGMAFLCRQMSLFLAPFFLVALCEHPRHRSRQEQVGAVLDFALGVSTGILGYLAFNAIRFGNPLETGYDLIYQNYPVEFLRERVRQYGLFHPVYIPFNFVHLFLQGFHLRFAPPTFTRIQEMDPFGTSLTFASPFLVVAFRARWNRPLLLAAWLSIAAILLGLLLYHANGWSQVNAQRYTLDFLPLLMLLVARGIPHVPPKVWKGTILYAIALNILALAVIPFLVAP